MIRTTLVVFDLDGTLVDSIRDIAAAVNDALRELAPGAPPLAVGQIHSFVGDGAAVLVTRSLAAAGLDRRLEEVLPAYLEAYKRRLLETTAFFPGVLEALDALRDRTLCVLTNKPGDLSRTLLAGLGAAHRFARIWGVGDVSGRKPDPAGLLRLMDELGVGAEEAAIVGDSPVDLATGRAAGVFTVGVTYGFDSRGVVAAGPDALVRDLRDLAPLLRDRDEHARRIPEA
jgi:phosphoglycolate phosphatase